MTQTTPPGWYHGDGDPAGTMRWWDGAQWIGDPQHNVGTQAAGKSATLTADVSASVLQRIVGRLVDFFLVLIPATVVLIGALDLDAFSTAITVLNEADPGDTRARIVFQDTTTPLLEDAFSTAATGMVLCFLAVWVFELVLVKTVGATPGKLLTGTRIISADRAPMERTDSAQMETTQLVSWNQAALRTAVRLLTVLSYGLVVAFGLFLLMAVAIALVSLVMLFTVDRRQTLMDKVARTVVVRRSALKNQH